VNNFVLELPHATALTENYSHLALFSYNNFNRYD